MPLKNQTIDIINIGLIVLSLVIAIFIPFELFLFSYAVLGPLHYITELRWLKQKNYFIQSKLIWLLPFIMSALAVSIYPTITYFKPNITGLLSDVTSQIADGSNFLLIGVFFFSLALILFRSKQLIMVFIASLFLAIILYFILPAHFVYFAVFLPTILHVYVFTALFILYGAKKSSSRIGYFTFLILLAIPVIIYYLPTDLIPYHPRESTLLTYQNSNMVKVNSFIAQLLGGLEDGHFYALSDVGIKIQIFIGFAYTYHYLNWFSKTSVIGWHKQLTTKKTMAIGLFWFAAIAIYFYDFQTGFIVLFLLSFIHVVMEFPLNAITIKELVSFKK
jgi:hypothetical protein